MKDLMHMERYENMKAIIWCEVSCTNCGDVIGFDYKNAKTISALKKAVKDWRYCEEAGNLCPDCYKNMKIAGLMEQVNETLYNGDNIGGHD